MNNNIIEQMRNRLLEVADPNNPYSQTDFDAEFSGDKMVTITPDYDFYKIKVKFVNKSTNQDPEYATSGSSGFDLRANIIPVDNGRGHMVDFITIKPMKREIIPTGLFFELPENFEIQVRPRSGLAAKNGVTVLNTPGTVDADYRGEIKVILINLGDENFIVNHGDRIAQGVFASVMGKNVIKLNKISELSEETERGSGGFGSTGKN